MPPRNFCDIDSKYYLFGKSDTPEEKVRQWMIFELLAVYNVPVQAISIESPVKVGTRQYRTDILLLKDYRPWAVIECKRQEDSDVSNGIQQAVSYASCLQAEFAAFTNGKNWLVKRCRSDQWISVPDLPIYSSKSYSTVNLQQLSAAYGGLLLLLRWVHGHYSNGLEARDLLVTALRKFAPRLDLISGKHTQLLYWSRFLTDFIEFFEKIDVIKCVHCSNHASLWPSKELIRVFRSLVRCYEKTDSSFNFEFLNTAIHHPLACCDTPCFESMHEILEFYQCNSDCLVDAFRLFLLYTNLINDHCEGLPGFEPILARLTNHLAHHLHGEWLVGEKNPISNSNVKLTLIIKELLGFIFEDHFHVSIPDILEKDDWDSIYNDLI